MADESLTFRAFGNDVSAGRMFGDLADKVDDAKNNIHDLGGESKSLDERLEETRTHLRALIDDFEKTGDTSLFRDIRRDRSHISMIESLRKELHDVEDDAHNVGQKIGNEVSGGIGDALGSIPSQLKGAAIVAGIALAPLLAAPVGAAIAGAVIGGVGLGGIVGGVIAAAQDERVGAAVEQLKGTFLTGFQAAGREFINPILDQMLTLQHTEDVVLSDLASGFASLAPLIKPVAEGLEGFAENLNLDSVFADAAPAVRAIAQELPEIGAAIGDALGAIGDESDGATEGLIALLHATEDLISGGGEFIAWLAGVFDWLVRTDEAAIQWALHILDAADAVSFLTGAAAPGLDAVRAHLEDTNDQLTSLTDGLKDAKDSGDDWRGSLAGQARSAADAAREVEDYKDALDKLFGIQMNLDEAQIHYQEAIDKTLQTLREGKRTLDINTQDGRDNKQAILDQVKAIEQLRKANIDNGMEVDAANKIADDQLNILRITAERLHFNKQQVDELVGAYINAHKEAYIATHVDDKSVVIAYNHVKAVEKAMNELDGQVATTYVRTVFGEFRAGERNPQGRASGGPVMAGRTYRVGENGPEILEMGASGGYVYNASQTRSMLSGASGGSVDVNVSVNAAGARDAFANAIMQLLRVDAGFRQTVKSYVGA